MLPLTELQSWVCVIIGYKLVALDELKLKQGFLKLEQY